MEQRCGFAVVMQTKCSACVHFPMRCVFIFGSRTDTVAKCETDGAARKSHIKSMSRVMGKIRAAVDEAILYLRLTSMSCGISHGTFCNWPVKIADY
jgi:hypothetical protein